MTIPTFVINLRSRPDRKAHSIREFAGRDEFRLQFVDAVAHEVGAVGLWHTIRHIIRDLVNEEDDFVLICEDDHVFTAEYSRDVLFERIAEAAKWDCDVLSGGVSWFMDAVQVSDHLFWTSRFSGTQFIIIFRKLFEAIVKTPFTVDDCADFKLAALSDKIYFVFPYLSIQREFGYSDVTPKNNGTERVETLFVNSAANAQNLIGVRKYFYGVRGGDDVYDVADLSIPTYVIDQGVLDQFAGKPEFDTVLVDACENEWLTIRRVVEQALLNDDHVIIICGAGHRFNSNYSKEYLFQAIIQAQRQRCDYLSCGTDGFNFAVPVARNRFWTNHFVSIQCIVLYRSLFKKILEAPFDEEVIVGWQLSQLAGNKMILYPFVSGEFEESAGRLQIVHDAWERHHSIDGVLI